MATIKAKDKPRVGEVKITPRLWPEAKIKLDELVAKTKKSQGAIISELLLAAEAE